ncbi:MAG: hypothetical protein A4E19_14755 [Nitrospira sp. SG-bin1]|nr:MAG: hypothetical protein A4E19_14755 [Nitrospira sp. SG-bin1]
MITEILLWLNSHRAAFFVLTIVFGALLGFCAGLLLYGIQWLTISDFTERQGKVTIVLFTVLGIGLGLYFLFVDFLPKERGGPKNNENGTDERISG